jgi:hypothetical protein
MYKERLPDKIEPTTKSPEIEKLLTQITGVDRPTAIRFSMCVTCGKAVTGFKDDLSRREYAISGMCQECQDAVFIQPDEDNEDDEYDDTGEEECAHTDCQRDRDYCPDCNNGSMYVSPDVDLEER